ncbi:MAG: DUF3487 family protein [Pseudomonadota bacterium]|nr:DUF3487 family protein [Pseudomonadota bacterium]
MHEKAIPTLTLEKIDHDPLVFRNVTLPEIHAAMMISLPVGIAAILVISLVSPIGFQIAVMLGLLTSVFTAIFIVLWLNILKRQKPPHYPIHHLSLVRERYGFGSAGFIHQGTVYEAFRL